MNLTLQLQLLVSGLAAAALLAPVAMGFSLILGIAKFWHVAHGAVFLLAAYVGYVALAILGWPYWLVLLLVPIVSGTGGLSLQWLIYEPLRRRRVSSRTMLIASLGILTVTNNVAALIFGFDSRAFHEVSLTGRIDIGSASMGTDDLMSIVYALAALAATWGLYRTRQGLAIRALVSSPSMAEIVGIDVGKVRALAFAWGSALVGVPAVLLVLDTGIEPNVSLNLVLLAAVAAIVGGIGQVFGAFVGSILVTVIEFQSVTVVSSQWSTAVVFIVLIAFIVLRPRGLFGSRLWRSEV